MKSSGRRRGGGGGWESSRRTLQTLTLFKTKNCLFCHPIKDRRPNFTTLIHFILHKEFRGAFYINIMKLEFFLKIYCWYLGMRIPCSRLKLVNLYYPENHTLCSLGQIRELLKKKKRRATAPSAVPLSNDICTIDVKCL